MASVIRLIQAHPADAQLDQDLGSFDGLDSLSCAKKLCLSSVVL